MTCDRAGAVVICTSPDYRIRDGRGKVWYFEFHWFCGPSVLRRDGAPAARQPGERSPFWAAFQAWFDGGKAAEDRGGQRWAKWAGEPAPH